MKGKKFIGTIKVKMANPQLDSTTSNTPLDIKFFLLITRNPTYICRKDKPGNTVTRLITTPQNKSRFHKLYKDSNPKYKVNQCNQMYISFCLKKCRTKSAFFLA